MPATDPPGIPAGVWNAIADAALAVLNPRPLFSRRQALVRSVVDHLAAAGYKIVEDGHPVGISYHSYDPKRCGCQARCGDDGDIDGPGTCKGLPS